MPAKTKKKTSMIPYDELLAKAALESAAMEASTGTGESFSIKGGQLSFNGSPIPGNQMAVVILDAVLHNANYPDKYDAKNPTSPDCFAFGRDEATMAPHKQCVDAGLAHAKTCAECPLNVFGSADNGKGKACSNGRRLALVSAGSIDAQGRTQMIDDPEHYKTAGVGYLKVPATSLKAYAAYVKQLAATLKRPPYGVVTKITVVPDAESQVKVTFELVGVIPGDVTGEVIERNKEAATLIEFPYGKYEKPGKAGKGKKGAEDPAPRAAAPKANAFSAPAKASKASKPAKAAKGKAAPAAAFGGKKDAPVARF